MGRSYSLKRIRTESSESDSSKVDLKMRLDLKENIRIRLVQIGTELLNLSEDNATKLALEYIRFIHLKTVLVLKISLQLWLLPEASIYYGSNIYWTPDHTKR
jgi:hypothetical protein